MKEKKRNYVGDVNVADANIISGWAFDKESPAEIVSVKISAPSKASWIISADITRRDLIDNKVGDGNHAFEFTPPEDLLDGKTHELVVTFEHTDKVLRRGKFLFGPYISNDKMKSPDVNKLIAVDLNKNSTDLMGDVNYADSGLVRGWAHDKSSPESHVAVRIENSLGQFYVVTADKQRQDLVAKGIGTGNHGFEFIFPSNFIKSDGDEIAITFEQSGKLLSRGKVKIKKFTPQKKVGTRVGDDAAKRIAAGTASEISVKANGNETQPSRGNGPGKNAEQKLVLDAIALFGFAELSDILVSATSAESHLHRLSGCEVKISDDNTVRSSCEILIDVMAKIKSNVNTVMVNLQSLLPCQPEHYAQNSDLEDPTYPIVRNFAVTWRKMNEEILSREATIAKIFHNIAILEERIATEKKANDILIKKLRSQLSVLKQIEEDLLQRSKT